MTPQTLPTPSSYLQHSQQLLSKREMLLWLAALPLVILFSLIHINPAHAQMPPGGGRGGMGGGMGPGMMKCPPPQMDVSAPNDRVQLELGTAKMTLRLATEQEAAWVRFEQTALKMQQDNSRMMSAKPTEPAVKSDLSGPQRIDQVLDSPRNRLTALEDVADSAKALYATLTPDQRRVADVRLTAIVHLLTHPAPKISEQMMQAMQNMQSKGPPKP